MTTESTTSSTQKTSRAELSRIERFSDWLNPLLMRDTYQFLRARLFSIAIGLSLLTTFVLLFIYLFDQSSSETKSSYRLFEQISYILFTLGCVVVPMQIFNSMRQDAQKNAYEMLALTRLRSWQIVTGKLASGLVLAGVLFSMCLPVLAFTGLLPGIQLRLLQSAFFVLILGMMVYSAVLLLLAAVAKGKIVRNLLSGVAGFLILIPYFLLSGLSSEIRDTLLRLDLFSWLAVGLFITASIIVVLCGMGTSNLLKHPSENRSTNTRLAAVGLFILGPIFIAWLGIEKALITAAFPWPCLVFLVILFFLMVTENKEVSRHVKGRVSKNRFIAVLSSPFLPGNTRGFLLVSLLTGAYGLIYVLESIKNAPAPWLSLPKHMMLHRISIAVALYTLFCAGLLCFFRGLFTAGALGSRKARWFGMLIFAVLWTVLPVIGISLRLHPTSRFWLTHPPVYPLSTMGGLTASQMQLLLAMCGVSIALNLPAIIASIREVWQASMARRTHAS